MITLLLLLLLWSISLLLWGWLASGWVENIMPTRLSEPLKLQQSVKRIGAGKEVSDMRYRRRGSYRTRVRRGRRGRRAVNRIGFRM